MHQRAAGTDFPCIVYPQALTPQALTTAAALDVMIGFHGEQEEVKEGTAMLLTAWCAQRTGEASWATTFLTCPAHDRERRNHFRSISEYL